MRLRLLALAFAAILIGSAVAPDAQARNSGRSGGQASGKGWHGNGSHGGHRYWHGGVFIGAGLYAPWYSWYGPYPSYYPFAVPVTFEQQYVEQYAVPLEQGFWYYCRSAGAYYPGVAECPEGWEQVAPQ